MVTRLGVVWVLYPSVTSSSVASIAQKSVALLTSKQSERASSVVVVFVFNQDFRYLHMYKIDYR